MVISCLIFSILLVFALRVLDAIKSGCFYAASRHDKPTLLKKYIDNIHYVQSPLWYCIFGVFGILLFTIFYLLNPAAIVLNLLAAYLISQGTSTMAGPLYQGFINVGCGLPFVDENENKKMEIANPLNNKTKWVKRFWYGKRRIYLAVIGLLMTISGFLIIFL
jgi:hypothetical protein